MRFRHIAALVAVALLVALPVAAQETTGAITGAVRGQDGALLPGATVVVTGPIGTVQAVSDERGEFRFPRLPSGRYTVKASLSGFATGESAVDLTVGSTGRVEFTLGLATVTETVNVVGESSAMDITSSSTTTNISRERIDLIPRGRDFTDVVSQAAGAQNESQAGGISIDGSSGSENRFVIDGIDTTSPQVGTSAVPLRADFLEEVQVKSAGYAAEYGGSTGGVINVITKSGSNAWHGGVLAQFEQRSWGGDERPLLRDDLNNPTYTYINPEKDDEWRVDPGLFLSGPILKDRLWFFGSYQPGIRSTERTVTFTNGVTNTFPQDFTVNYGTANITGNIASKLLFRAGVNYSPYSTEKTLPGQDGRTSLTSPDQYLRGFDGKRNTISGSLDWTPTNSFVVSARAGRYRTDGVSTGITFPGLIHNFSTASTPAGLNALGPYRQPAGFTSDILVTDAQAKDEYKRDYIGIDATYFFNGGGEHQLKFGYQTEKIYNDVQRGYNADRVLYYAGRTYLSSTGQVRSGPYGYFRLLNISTLGAVESRNEALFIQDTWRVTPRLTLNLGLRSEHEKIPNFGTEGVETPIEFTWGDKLAPRLGFTFDILGDAKWKLYGSYGKYYDVMKYEMPRGSFGGDKWVDFFYTWDNPDYSVNGSGCATGTNTIVERPNCAGGTLIEALDRRFNSATDLAGTVEPDLQPMESDEFQVGLSHELGGSYVAGARFIYKHLIRTIEDVGIVVPGIGEVFYIANPGEGITLELNDPSIPTFPKAKRDYTGVELTFQRRFSNNWGLFASYTYSKLYGNYSGLASSDEDGRTSPNVNRYFDHIEDTFDRNGDRVEGRLATDRPHVFKGQFMYRFGWDMTASINQYIGSGIPISEQANTGAGVPFFPYGRGNLGRVDTLVNTDLSIFQNFNLGKFDLQLGLTVLNLFDQEAATRQYNDRLVGSVPLTTEDFFAGGWNYEQLIAANPSLVDVKFNQPDQFQAPRSFRLSMRFQF
jgi:outer membrane receptor protein involved in Fe transport